MPHLLLLNRKLVATATGRTKRLIIEIPPRHGKSEFISRYFPAWYIGNWPDNRIILSAYGDGFAASWGRKSRDVLEEFGWLFNMQLRFDSKAAHEWNVYRREGGMKTAGVGGAIGGRGMNIGIVDDAFKNAEDAFNESYQEMVWEWFISTFVPRLEPDGAIIVAQARWHKRDLIGRILEQSKQTGEHWEVVKLPAICNSPDDALGRSLGMALWPQRFNIERLEAIARSIGGIDGYFWNALYQQEPMDKIGTKILRAWFKILARIPMGVKRAVRYWDLAATEKKPGNDPDFTAGSKMLELEDGRLPLAHVIQARGTPREVEQLILSTAHADGKDVAIRMEREPGSAGVNTIARYAQLLLGFDFRGVPVTGNRELRIDRYASGVQAGLVPLIAGDWNEHYLDEVASYVPGGSMHDDQLTSSTGAFEELTAGGQLGVDRLTEPKADTPGAAILRAAEIDAEPLRVRESLKHHMSSLYQGRPVKWNDIPKEHWPVICDLLTEMAGHLTEGGDSVRAQIFLEERRHSPYNSA